MMSSPWKRHNGLILITTDTEITKQVLTRICAPLSRDFRNTTGWVVPMRTKMDTPILHQIGPQLTEQMHSLQSTLSGKTQTQTDSEITPHLPTLQTTAQTKRVLASKTSPGVAILMRMAGQMREMRSFTSPVNGPTATLTDMGIIHILPISRIIALINGETQAYHCLDALTWMVMAGQISRTPTQ